MEISETEASVTSCYVCLPYLEEDRKFISDLESVFDTVEVHGEDSRPAKERLKTVARDYEAVIVGTSEEMDAEVAEAAEGAEGRFIFTPHTAGLTQESSRRMRDELARKLASTFE